MTGDSYSSPVLAEINVDGIPYVIVISYSWDSIYALDGTDGSVIWSYRLVSSAAQSSPVLGYVDNNGILDVVLADTPRIVTVLEAHSGKLVWSEGLP